MRLIAPNCASIFSFSFSPRRSGALATPVRFMWLKTVHGGSVQAHSREGNAVSACRSWKQQTTSPACLVRGKSVNYQMHRRRTTSHHPPQQGDKQLGRQSTVVGAIPKCAPRVHRRGRADRLPLARPLDHRCLTFLAPGLAVHGIGTKPRLIPEIRLHRLRLPPVWQWQETARAAMPRSLPDRVGKPAAAVFAASVPAWRATPPPPSRQAEC